MNTYKIVCYRPTSVSVAVALLKPGEDIPEEYEDHILRVFEKLLASNSEAEIFAQGVAAGIEVSGMAVGEVKWRWGFAPISNGIPELNKNIKIVPPPTEAEYQVVVRRDLDIEIYAPGIDVPEGVDVLSILTRSGTERDVTIYAQGVAAGLELKSSLKVQVIWARQSVSPNSKPKFKWENYS